MNGKSRAVVVSKRMVRVAAALVTTLLCSSTFALAPSFTGILEAGQIEVWVVPPEAVDTGSVVWVPLPVWADLRELGSLHVQPVLTPEMQTSEKVDLSLLQVKPVTFSGRYANTLPPLGKTHLQMEIAILLLTDSRPHFVEYFPIEVRGDGIFEMDLHISAQTPDRQPLMIREADNVFPVKETRLFVLRLDRRILVGTSLHDVLRRYAVDQMWRESKELTALRDQSNTFFQRDHFAVARSADENMEDMQAFLNIHGKAHEIIMRDMGGNYAKYIWNFARAKARVYNEFGYDPQRKQNTLAMEYAGILGYLMMRRSFLGGCIFSVALSGQAFISPHQRATRFRR